MSSRSPLLVHFLYVSRALRPFDTWELGRLLDGARRFNEAHAVTGLLLYDVVPELDLARFCQYVEGPAASLDAVRRRIEGDGRHLDLAYLHGGLRDARLFDGWSMAYTPVSALDAPEAVRGLLARPSSLDPVPRSTVTALVRRFMALSESLQSGPSPATPVVHGARAARPR